MRPARFALINALAVAFAASLALPAPADARPRRGGPVAQQQPKQPRREKAKARIRAMRALILAEELELDEATAGKLAPVLNRFDDELARLLADRARLREELRSAEGAGDDPRMTSLLDALVKNQDQRWDLERQRFADLRRVLSPRQAARLVDILPEIDRRILKGLRASRNPVP